MYQDLIDLISGNLKYKNIKGTNMTKFCLPTKNEDQLLKVSMQVQHCKVNPLQGK